MSLAEKFPTNGAEDPVRVGGRGLRLRRRPRRFAVAAAVVLPGLETKGKSLEAIRP